MDLEDLKQKRKTEKARLTRFKTFLDNVSTNPQTANQIPARLQKINEAFDSYQDIQSKIESLDKTNDFLIEQETDRQQFEDSYFSAVANANSILGITDIYQPLLNNHTNSNNIANSNNSGNDHNFKQSVKLPPLSLETFDGSYQNWQQFYDTFKALIHENKNLTNVEKFYYLNSALSNTPKEVIKSLEITNDNYTIALNLLKERFENKRLTIRQHVLAIFNIEPIQRESASSLRILIDNLSKHLRALEALGEPVDKWDTLILHLISSKLDSTTKREWESRVIYENLDSVSELTTFLTDRCQVLEAVQANKQIKSESLNKRSDRSLSHVVSETKSIKCPLCNEEHKLYQCQVFINLPITARYSEVKKHKRCLNCLGIGHSVKFCKSRHCKECNAKHNSLLHRNDLRQKSESQSSALAISSDDLNQGQPSNQTLNACVTNCASKNLLSTALIYVQDKSGTLHEARALLDNGSQPNMISREFSKKLKLPTTQTELSIGGIGKTLVSVPEWTIATIQSRVNSFSTKLHFSILDDITLDVPLSTFNPDSIKVPNNIKLADPNFANSRKIDVLLGAGIFWHLIGPRQISTGINQPVMRETKLGWIIGGTLPLHSKQQQNSTTFCGLVRDISLQEQLERFWKLEEYQEDRPFSKEELACEESFRQTHKRDLNGRFEVELPLREKASALGESRLTALKRLYSMERKFEKDSYLREEYIKFQKEYEELQHMSEVRISNDVLKRNYLPHHAVVKESRTTTKVRVVLDASCKTSSGKSLNDLLMIGPVIQKDLVDITIRFRLYPLVITGDIEKMYRQVKISEHQRSLQTILWRSNKDEPVKEYQLNTLTFGTATASFLATRCLHQLALENEDKYPQTSRVIKHDFYVDDLLTGASTVQEAIDLKRDITTILRSGCFNIRKWNSNSKDILEEQGIEIHVREIGEGTKILGLLWMAESDQFSYNIGNLSESKETSKRKILSIISQIFDPLGLIGPVIIKLKILLQRLWKMKFEWDAPLPDEIQRSWKNYKEQLVAINEIQIPRQIVCLHPVRVEIHGFCDASEEAYGACLYGKSIDNSGRPMIRLICAKSRVAPIKFTSLPRLELQGAVLLARLHKKVKNSLTIKIDADYFWSDSIIALSWIKGEPSQWKTYVSNRVTEIQGLTNKDSWNYVKSENNSADIISRGLDPRQLKEHKLWWQGPSWLQLKEKDWPRRTSQYNFDVPEKRKINLITLATEVLGNDIFARYSTLNKLKRVTAYVWRFINNLRAKIAKKPRLTEEISAVELSQALYSLVKSVQMEQFPKEIQRLKSNLELSSKSRLLSLHPFLDKNGLVRVGGRLKNAPIHYSCKFPIVLPSKHKLTELIIRDAHHRQLHVGTQTLLATLRETYWILSAKNAIRRVLSKCVTCFRVRPKTLTQLMGNLPSVRVTPSRAFSVTGVDYAGPFSIKISRNKSAKAYLCIFICMAVKAVHLEVSSDLTTNAFLNSFKRFIARRGKPTKVMSDNGTNFVGARNKLHELKEFLGKKENQSKIVNFAANQSIEWEFITPYSPHVGGLWEAAVKSAKTHFKKTIGETLLSFEEFQTIFCQVEACMNSRPLCQLTSDPNDFTALTPGHFLVGASLHALPEEDLSDVKLNRLSRYELLMHMYQNFWKKWSTEYVTQLQQRGKWCQINKNEMIKLGAMAILKEINTPPLSWKLGRIERLYPGDDGLIRKVSVRTASGVVERSLPKICVLPIET